MASERSGRLALESGNSLLRQGKFEEALKAYEEAIKHEPGARAWGNKGAVLGELGRLEEAIEALDEAIKCEPGYARAWFNKGVALGRLGRREAALEAYETATRHKPDFGEAWYSKGAALAELGRQQEASQAFAQAASFGYELENASTAVDEMGAAPVRLRQRRGVVQASPEDTEGLPDFGQAWYRQGVDLARSGRFEEALRSFEEAVKVRPELAEAWCGRGDVLFRAGLYPKALDSYDRATTVRPDYARAWYNRGVTLQRMGKPKEAEKAFKEALSSDVGLGVAREALAELREEGQSWWAWWFCGSWHRRALGGFVLTVFLISISSPLLATGIWHTLNTGQTWEYYVVPATASLLFLTFPVLKWFRPHVAQPDILPFELGTGESGSRPGKSGI